MADEQTPPQAEPKNRIAAYEEQLAAALALPLEEGFVDPHLAATSKGADFDVDPRIDPDADVNGTRDDGGPSDAELAAGEEDGDFNSGFPTDEDEGQQGDNNGLPTDEDEGQQGDNNGLPSKARSSTRSKLQSIPKTLLPISRLS
jgi:hypothetical protein